METFHVKSHYSRVKVCIIMLLCSEIRHIYELVPKTQGRKDEKEMKKMSFVTKGLALLLMGVMLAGCGDKATESSSDDKQQESSVEEKSSSVQESTEDAGTEENSVAGTEESSVASTDESIQESTQESTQTIGDEPSDKAKAYEEYFKNYSMDGKKISLNMEEEVDGKKISIEFSFGSKDGDTYMFMSVPTPTAGGKNEMAAYFMKDQSAYVSFNVAGEDPVAQKTTGLDPAMASQFNLAGSLVNVGEGGFSLKYLGEETIDGVTYDKLQPTDSEDATLYVNVATKEWEMIKGNDGGQEVVAYIKPCESITLPAELASAEEVGSDDFSMTLVFGMMGLISSVQGE